MNKIFVIVFLIVSLIACSKNEQNLELFSPEAYAYTLDSGWELNVSCFIKGFAVKEKNSKHNVRISFNLDLKLPDSLINKNIFQGKMEQLIEKDIIELPFNVQIPLSSSYKMGKYVLIINAIDNNSGIKTTVEKEFEL